MKILIKKLEIEIIFFYYADLSLLVICFLIELGKVVNYICISKI